MAVNIEENATDVPELQDKLQPDSGSGVPSEELGTNGPDVEACVREALEALAGRSGHGPNGRFTKANVEAGNTLWRSEGFWKAVAPAKRELVEKVRNDVAADATAAETKLGLLDAYAEVRLFRSSMFLRLVGQGGPITAKDKVRALYATYLATLDREMKLAQQLGLDRKPRGVVDIARALAETAR